MNVINIFVALLVLVNVAALLLVGVDKQKSIANSKRVPEVYLFFMASLFASPGVFLGMFLFRHKTQKIYFPLGIGLLLVQQILLCYFIFKYLQY